MIASWSLATTAMRTTPQAVEEYLGGGSSNVGGGNALAGLPPPAYSQFPLMGFPAQQQPMGFPQQPGGLGQWGGGWPGAMWSPLAAPPAKPVKEVPTPRMLLPGWGIIDMPNVGSLPSFGVPPKPEVDDDTTSSYNATEVVGSREGEIKRLQTQIRLSFHKELRHLQWHGLADGAALLELGCGPGWSTEQFARALPSSRITCVEVDAGFVEVARALLAHNPRVSIRRGLAQSTGLPDASFDFVTMRFLLQHLRRPSLVLREALRVLRPGGGVAVVETDDMIGGVMDPLLPSLQPLNLKFSARQAHKGGSRFVGRHLLRMMRQLGCEALHIEASLAASDEFDEGVRVFAPHFDVARFQVLLDEGQLSATEFEQARSAMQTFLADPSAIAMMVNVVGMGKKPTRDGAHVAALAAPEPPEPPFEVHHHHPQQHLHAAHLHTPPSSRLTPTEDGDADSDGDSDGGADDADGGAEMF